MKRKIGLLGFSANPPHCGHLEIVRLLLSKKLVNEVWMVPCFKHSFGKKLAPSHHRWQMAKLLEQKWIRASDVEIYRKGKSYTIDTIKILKEKFPDYQFFWIFGSDIVKSGNYKKWRDWEKLAHLVDFFVVIRPGFEIKKVPAGFTLIKGKISDVSSTEIRKRIRRGLSIKGLVQPKVKSYIEKNNLYRVRRLTK